MTLVVTAVVHCDHPAGCPEHIHGTTSPDEQGVEARAEASFHGWISKKTPGGWEDLCPAHTPQWDGPT